QESWLVRGVARVYRPVLSWFLDRPGGIVWVVAATFLVGFATAGERYLLLGVLGLALLAGLPLVRETWSRVGFDAGLNLVALLAEQNMTPPGRDVMVRLDEGMTMDMPITVPGASITQSSDDLKARDMILCRFPEVDMVVGKAGRADTPTDPAPMDMIETMVNFRPREFWPRRGLAERDARRMIALALERLVTHAIIKSLPSRETTLAESLAEILPGFDVQMREFAYLRNAEFLRERASDLGVHSHDGLTPRQAELWRDHVRALDAELIERGASVFARLAVEDLISRTPVRDPEIG